MKHGAASRRQFLKRAAAGAAGLALWTDGSSAQPKPARPNILWLVSEDNGTFLGSFGDAFADTPNLDRLASQGVRYANCFTTCPVCAPSRSTLISGMFPIAMGTEPMRSTNRIPGWIRFFPQLLREAGYYCTNNAKEDYNMPKPDGVWDESSRQATYRNRKPGQPFFAVFNTEISHESSIHTTETELTHDPAGVTLPPYHPDTPEMRRDWAQYYDKITAMDRRIGELLAGLEQEGLDEDTIVFYYSDNAGVVARSKRYLYDSGIHVPLIIRFPEKYRHLAPAPGGSRLDRLVSFVDFAPTVLSLAGIPVPETMQGRAFLGPQQTAPREAVHAFRGRMDERMDLSRAVRDKRFKYIRNFMPHLPYGQYHEYLFKAPSIRSWEKAYREGKCNTVQSAFFREKPVEELYDVQADPHEVVNLAADPKYRTVLDRLRKSLRRWQVDMRDSGLMPEGEMEHQARTGTVWDTVHRADYPIARILDTAEKAAGRNPSHLPELVRRMKDRHPVVRFWAAMGCRVLGGTAASAAPDLESLAGDPSGDVRAAAGEALCAMGRMDKGLPLLITALEHENPRVVLRALNALELLGAAAQPASDTVRKIAGTNKEQYVVRAVNRFLETHP